jgi:hypothetical protein
VFTGSYVGLESEASDIAGTRAWCRASSKHRNTPAP